MTVTHRNAGNGDADCNFDRKRGAFTYELRIGVQTVDSPRNEFAALAAQCRPNPASLKAIGNEAVLCNTRSPGGRSVAQVVSRVRNRVFTIRITTNDSMLTPGWLDERARDVAEQVAGNLF